MTRATFWFCLLCIPALGIATALPAHARGGGSDGRGGAGRGGPPVSGKTAVEQLSESELALLKQKIPSWDQLDARRQEGIARHVVRMRTMDAAERERFQGRLRRWRDARGQGGPGGRSERPHRGPSSHPSVFLAVFGQTVQAMLRTDWPEGLAQAKAKGLSESRVALTFVRHMLVPAIANHELKLALADDFDLASLALSEKWQSKMQGVLARVREHTGDTSDESGPGAKARRGAGRMLFHARINALRASLSARTRPAQEALPQIPTAESVVARVDAYVRSQWAAPYELALTNARSNTAKLFKRTEGNRRTREWVAFVYQLDRIATHAKSQPGASSSGPSIAKDADALFRRVLREQFKITDESIDGLPARGDRRRWVALSKLHKDFRFRGKSGRGARGESSRRGDRRGRSGRRGPRSDGRVGKDGNVGKDGSVDRDENK